MTLGDLVRSGQDPVNRPVEVVTALGSAHGAVLNREGVKGQVARKIAAKTFTAEDTPQVELIFRVLSESNESIGVLDRVEAEDRETAMELAQLFLLKMLHGEKVYTVVLVAPWQTEGETKGYISAVRLPYKVECADGVWRDDLGCGVFTRLGIQND
jgi:hypothetical protein